MVLNRYRAIINATTSQEADISVVLHARRLPLRLEFGIPVEIVLPAFVQVVGRE